MDEETANAGDHGGARALVRRRGRRRAGERAGAGAGGAPRLTRPRSRPAADDPEDEPETGPLRRCIVTRERRRRSGMIRFVVGPGPGAGARPCGKAARAGNWLSARADVLETRPRPRASSPGPHVARSRCPPISRRCCSAGLARRIGGSARLRAAGRTGGRAGSRRRASGSRRPGRRCGAGGGRQRRTNGRGSCSAGMRTVPVVDAACRPRRWARCSAGTVRCTWRWRRGGWRADRGRGGAAGRVRGDGRAQAPAAGPVRVG